MRWGKAVIAVTGVAVLAVLTMVKLNDPVPFEMQEIVRNSSIFEIVSLDPKLNHPDSAHRFYRWTELGRATVASTTTKAALINAVYDGIAKGAYAGMKCFNPRHAIHVVSGKKTLDILVCFECRHVRFVLGGHQIEKNIDSSFEQLFDDTLKEHKIPLAPKPSRG